MATQTRTAYQALVVPDPRAEIVAATAVDTAGAFTGQPAPAAATRLALTTRYRARTATDATIEIQTAAGGMPALTATGRPASFLWRREGDTDAEWRGWNGPEVLQRVYKLHQEKSIGTLDKFQRPAACATPSGVLIACEYQTTLGYGWKVSRGALSGTDPGALATVAGNDRRSGYRGCCALVYCSDGRTMLYAAQTRTTSSTAPTVVSAWTSTDDGATWSLSAENVLPADLASDEEVRRVRVAERNGQLVMLVHVKDATRTNSADYLVQYASNDGGYSFQQIAAHADTANVGGGFPDVIAGVDGFILTWIDLDTRQGLCARLGSAFQSFITAAASEVTAGAIAAASGTPEAFTTGGLAVCELDDGMLVAYACNYGTGGLDNDVCVSTDRGVTWTSRGQWWGTNLAIGNANPGNPAAACVAGHVLLVAGDIPATSTLDESVTAYTLGGHSNIGNDGEGETYYGGWLPLDLPEDYGWTATDDASITISYTAGTFKATSSGSGQAYRRHIASASTGAYVNITARTAAAPISRGGSSTYAGPAYIEAITGDGATVSYHVRLSVDSAGVHYARNTGSGWTDTDSVLVSLTDVVELRLVMDVASCSCYYRDASAGLSQPWVLAFTKTVTARTTTTNLVAFGGELDNGESFEWASVFIGTGLGTLAGRPFSTRPLEVADGVALTATGGPTVPGDEWSVATDYEYPRSNLAVPSPRKAWRSIATASQSGEITIEWTLSSGTSSALATAGAVAVPLIGHNLHYVTLGLYYGGAWTNHTVQAGITGLGFDRAGNVVSAPTSTGHDGTANPVVRENEFAGGVWYAAPGATGRRIIANSSGTWSRTTTGTQPRLVLEGVDDGADATSGATGIIVPPSCVIVGPVNQAYALDAIRIKIPEPNGTTVCDPPEGYWQIGYAVPSRVLVHADPQDWGRIIETESPTEVVDLPGNVRRTRRTGPTRRKVSFAWADGGVDTTGGDVVSWDSSGVSPPYTAGPLATVGSTPWQVEALVGILDGPDKPVQYLPRLALSALVNVVNRRHDLVHMRITSPVRLETIQGEEGVDEVIRIATVTGEEEV